MPQQEGLRVYSYAPFLLALFASCVWMAMESAKLPAPTATPACYHAFPSIWGSILLLKPKEGLSSRSCFCKQQQETSSKLKH